MNQRRESGQWTYTLDALALSMLSTLVASLAIWCYLSLQTIAQRPAQHGVMSFHISRTGELRLWNQPILPQDLPSLLQKAQARSNTEQKLVVRLVPDPQVPWGVTHRMLNRLQPDSRGRNWILQLQLP